MIALAWTYMAGLPAWVLASIGAVIFSATFFGLMAWAQRLDARRGKHGYHPLSDLVGPALQRFSEVLAQREGKDFTNNRQWELDLNYVILIASEDCRTVYRLRIPNRYFFAPHDILHEVDFRVSVGEYTKTETTGE